MVEGGNTTRLEEKPVQKDKKQYLEEGKSWTRCKKSHFHSEHVQAPGCGAGKFPPLETFAGQGREPPDVLKPALL